MTQKKFAFTNRNIAALPAHDPNSASKSSEYSDATVAGLKLIVGANGSKRFAFRDQTAGGRKRYAPLGTFPAIDVAEARRLALEMRAVVAPTPYALAASPTPTGTPPRLARLPTVGKTSSLAEGKTSGEDSS